MHIFLLQTVSNLELIYFNPTMLSSIRILSRVFFTWSSFSLNHRVFFQQWMILDCPDILESRMETEFGLAMIQRDSKLRWVEDWPGGERIGSRRKVGNRCQTPFVEPSCGL